MQAVELVGLLEWLDSLPVVLPQALIHVGEQIISRGVPSEAPESASLPKLDI